MREIAAKLGVAASTAHADIRAGGVDLAPVPNLQDRNGQPVAGAETGNVRSLVHGAYSERTLAPLREEHGRALRQDFPNLDDRRLVLLADRLARIHLAQAWLDRQGGIVRDDQGRVYDVADRAEKWSNRAEDILAQLLEEQREGRRYEALSEFMAEDGDDGTT